MDDYNLDTYLSPILDYVLVYFFCSWEAYDLFANAYSSFLL